jgi:hypothetical protein
MKTVIASSENLEGEIDLCGSEDLHRLHFNCHVERTQ